MLKNATRMRGRSHEQKLERKLNANFKQFLMLKTSFHGLNFGLEICVGKYGGLKSIGPREIYLIGSGLGVFRWQAWRSR